MCPKEGILHLPLYVLFDKEVGACALAIEERTRLGLERAGGGSGVSAEGASNIAKYSNSTPLKQD